VQQQLSNWQVNRDEVCRKTGRQRGESMENRIAAAALVSLLAGCSSAPTELNTRLEVDKVIQPLSRNEVINGVTECEGNGLRAVMLYSKRKVNGYTSEVVIDVTCAPRYRTY